MLTTFWSWFQLHEHAIRNAMDLKNRPNDLVLTELGRKLNAVSPALTFILDKKYKSEKHIYSLIISCAGQRDYFWLVKTLIASAPEIGNWKIKPFLPSVKCHVELDRKTLAFGDCIIEATSIKFAIHDYDLENLLFEILLLLPNTLSVIGDTKLLDYIYAMFFEIWGERLVGLRIHEVFITFHRHNDYAFIELEDLPFVLENFRLVMGLEDD